MLFDKTNYGNPISEKLAEYLKEWTDNNDRANVAAQTGVGISTIRDVTYRANNLTESNSVAIVELMKIAVKNCTNKIQYAKQVKRELETQLSA